VRSGQCDASTLSAILTQQVLQQCTVAQLAVDVAHLQQGAQQQQEQGNHVALAFYQQLAAICKVRWLRAGNCTMLCSIQQLTMFTSAWPACLMCAARLWPAVQALLPADGSADGLVPALLYCSSSEQPPAEPVVPAAGLLAAMTQANSSNSERLLAGLTMLAALATDAALLPAGLVEAAAAVELPKASAEDILQVLADPAAVAACLHVTITPAHDAEKGPETAASTGVLLRQAAACVLQLAMAAEPAVAAAFSACGGCLSGLVKLVAASGTSSSTPDAIKVSVLQLLHSLSSAAAGATSVSASTAMAADGTAVPAATAAAAVKELVVQHKIIPCLVQMLGEVRVVKGRPAVSAAALAAQRAPSPPPSTYSRLTAGGTAGSAAKGARAPAASSDAGRKRAAGRPAEAGAAAAAAGTGAAAAAAVPCVLLAGSSDITLAGAKLLQSLCGTYTVSGWQVRMRHDCILPAQPLCVTSKIHRHIACIRT
jgi:hypothetical protein